MAKIEQADILVNNDSKPPLRHPQKRHLTTTKWKTQKLTDAEKDRILEHERDGTRFGQIIQKRVNRYPATISCFFRRKKAVVAPKGQLTDDEKNDILRYAHKGQKVSHIQALLNIPRYKILMFLRQNKAEATPKGLLTNDEKVQTLRCGRKRWTVPHMEERLNVNRSRYKIAMFLKQYKIGAAARGVIYNRKARVQALSDEKISEILERVERPHKTTRKKSQRTEMDTEGGFPSIPKDWASSDWAREKGRRLRDDQKALIVALHKEGKKVPEIAEQVHKSRDAIRYFLRQYERGAPITDLRYLTGREQALIMSGHKAQKSVKEIRASIRIRFGIIRSTTIISNFLKRHNLRSHLRVTRTTPEERNIIFTLRDRKVSEIRRYVDTHDETIMWVLRSFEKQEIESGQRSYLDILFREIPDDPED